jgi:hypothetical protein
MAGVAAASQSAGPRSGGPDTGLARRFEFIMSTIKGIVLVALLSIVVAVRAAGAEPSYLVYPSSPAVFHYDTSRFELVTPGDPRFDPQYQIGNQMLWDRMGGRVAFEIYRAPLLTGFEPSFGGLNEFVTVGNVFDVIVDGFGMSPRTIGSLCLRFWPESNSPVSLTVDGQPVTRLSLPLPMMEVTTPLGSGYYGDTRVHSFNWVGSRTIRIIAFSDKNANGAFDGTPLYTIVAHDVAVPVESRSLGAVKALYRD